MKYAIISDLHLGQNGDHGFQSSLGRLDHENKQWLIDRLNAYSKEEELTLIANGDVLDLSLSTMKDSLEDLAALLKNINNLSRFVYVVGNHDHHVWMMFSEYAKFIKPLSRGSAPKNEDIYHPTPLEGSTSLLLGKYMKKKLGGDIVFDIAYPSFQFQVRNKLVRVTHGHLFGGLYTLTSRILKDFIKSKDKEHVTATANLALIELIYWLIGKMGNNLGVDGLIEAIYADIENGKKSLLRKLFSESVDTLFPKGVISWIPDSWERRLLKWISRRLVSKIVKDRSRGVCSEERHKPTSSTRQSVKDYIDEYLVGLKEEGTEIILTSGHTHVSDYFVHNDVKFYNTGSWLIEAEHPKPHSQILLVDDMGCWMVTPDMGC